MLSVSRSVGITHSLDPFHRYLLGRQWCNLTKQKIIQFSNISTSTPSNKTFILLTSYFDIAGLLTIKICSQIYDWDKKTQGVILSSFFWGYMMMQIPAGVLAKKYGGKLIMLCALLVNGVLCLALPTLVYYVSMEENR